MSNVTLEQVNEQAQRFKRLKPGLRAKLILIFASVMIVPIVALTIATLNQITLLSRELRVTSVSDSATALNDIARDNLERMTTDTAAAIAEFLYQRDHDVLLLSELIPSDSSYRAFSLNRQGNLTTMGEWVLSDDKMTWEEVAPYKYEGSLDVSSNSENNDIVLGSGFNYRPPELFSVYHRMFPLYDEISFIDLDGQEIYKYINPVTTKVNYPMNREKVNISDQMNTYVKAETYWEELQKLDPGEIYVSDVIGAYVGTNYVGMYTPGALKNDVPSTHPNYDVLQEIADLPAREFLEVARQQAFAGIENPMGQRFEGIVRWATPVADDFGAIIGYVTMALNHDHIMEFVDFITPMQERYTPLSNAHSGNYAFIWDYKCRSIAHPRHHSIVGYNPLTGEPQVPWLEGSVQMERDYINGGFILDGDGRSIPILDSDRNTALATDTPFYLWYNSGGSEWLESNPSWNNLSEDRSGTSWGEFYSNNADNREILPQFGERPLRDSEGNTISDENGNLILDSQSRRKTPARALTAAGFVGLDGRYLNNAPQCTGWMDLTQNGGSGSFYIYWSDLYKPTTAGAITYYTGQYSKEVQGNSRGFAFVTIGSGIEDFTVPAVEMEAHLLDVIDRNMYRSNIRLIITNISVFVLVIVVAILTASVATKSIRLLVEGIYRFRTGDRSFRLHSRATDEFGELADSFDDMADSIENSVKSPLVIIDKDYRVIYINKYVHKTMLRNIGDAIGLLYADITLYPLNSKYDPIKALHEGREAQVFHRKEDNRYFMGSANYMYDNSGIVTGYIILTTEVTEIQIARRKAEHASEAKSNFLSNMSHEIRTPLNAIMGMTSIGVSSYDVDKKNYALGQIQTASIHLSRIINDILDVSKIEANKFALSPVNFSINEVVERVVNMIDFRIQEKRQNFSVSVDKSIPNELFGDDQRFAQVLMNLLSNSVKFTAEEGSIHLDMSLQDKQDEHCTILVAVTDNGIGITEEQQSNLFISFEQADTSTSRRFGGTGLGLAICKSIIEMMNGEIIVSSQQGLGTTISFTAKFAYEIDGQKTQLQKSCINSGDDRTNFSGFTVLLAEDIEINREIIVTLLEPTELKIRCAKNGVEAVDSFVSEPNDYDLIFMDIQMPEMDGYVATKLIRESGVERAKDIPIIAMTANAFREDILKCLEAGMNDHIGKPVEFDVVIEKLKKYLCLPNPNCTEN